MDFQWPKNGVRIIVKCKVEGRPLDIMLHGTLITTNM